MRKEKGGNVDSKKNGTRGEGEVVLRRMCNKGIVQNGRGRMVMKDGCGMKSSLARKPTEKFLREPPTHPPIPSFPVAFVSGH